MSKKFPPSLTGFGASRPDFGAIKASVDLAEVVRRSGIELKAEGKDLVGLCPFHEDTRPSLRVTPAKGLFRCMSCGAAGNVIQFVARRHGLTEREAALRLYSSIPGVRRGSELPEPPAPAPAATAAPLVIDEATRAQLLGRVAAFYAKTLAREPAGLDYLAGRGLGEPALREAFGLGYCNGTMRGALPPAGEIVEQLQALGILNEKGNEVFYGRVVVPVRDERGNVVSLYGRRIGDEMPRHLYLRGPLRGVFNGEAAAAGARRLIVVEAIFDALSLWAAGWRDVVALYGKDGWTAAHDALLESGAVREVVLALDADARGQEAAGALETRLAGRVAVVRRVAWPEGIKDANALLVAHGAGAFDALFLPQPSAVGSPPAVTAGEEKSGVGAGRVEDEHGDLSGALAVNADGFVFVRAGRSYELGAIEQPSAARLKASVRARPEKGAPAARFHLDGVDFYASRSRKTFAAEAAPLLGAAVEVIEEDLRELTLALERHLAARAAGAPGAAVAAGANAEERALALDLARQPDLLGELQRDLARLGLVGEETNRLLLYLAMTSRKMDDPLAVQILSSSGAGKSHLQDAVLSLCPEEDLIKLTSLSGQALFYKGPDSLRHKCLAIAEVAGAEGARYALRNLISERKLIIETTVKNAQTGRLETQLNTVHGPTAVFETTTQPDTDAETKSRYVLLSVDESPEQTRAIVEAQRHSHTLEGRKRRKARETIRARHQAFQRWLEPVPVVNPFEPLLSYGDGRLAFRRDHPKYLNLILAVTFLHQGQRERKHDAELGEYIETTLEDIGAANRLAHELFGQSVDDLSQPGRRVLEQIAAHVQARAVETKKEAAAVEFTRRELREVFGWSDTRLRVHLRELVEMEYLVPVTGRMGARFCYRLALDPAALGGGRGVPGLKDAQALRAELANLAAEAPNLAAENGHLAATSPVESGEVLSLAQPLEHKRNGQHTANLAGLGGMRTGNHAANGALNGTHEFELAEARA